MELTVLMPCLNEAETLATCIVKAQRFLQAAGIDGEIVIADNGSTDGSREIAAAAGARVVDVTERGYGAALAGGIDAANGRFVIMGDADDSYDFSALAGILQSLRAGNELVMGNRFRGGIGAGAMPFLHRYLGNPVLSCLGRLFYRVPIGDFHCGLRGFSREAIRSLQLSSPGMEFASEMVVKSGLHGLRIDEVPVTLSRDGRSRPPHLRTWRDGWRHLKFLLLHSPRWLFLLPGLMLLLAGAGAMSAIAFRWVELDIHTMAYAGAAITLGVQMLLLAAFTRLMGALRGWLPASERKQRWASRLRIEPCLIVAGTLFLTGLAMSLHALELWAAVDYGELDPRVTMRWVVPSVTILAVAGEILLAGFFFEALRIPARQAPPLLRGASSDD
ncbi:glycosyltransferase family 2 protein [Luteimonas composti]|uniref:Glycosyltransferase family 2 protein n=1 Tax=Luteimonas composti TaxID=398257 RepID=A0ABT6MP56_9GAMM|nr:glycosyltransferase family 2 protein [Luteimonas composti]MDH7452392.1 glycosyltransferase family 2 protein [Luteimonas composti]